MINDNNDELMPLFKVNVDGVQRILEIIKSNIVKIEELKKGYTSATRSDAEKGWYKLIRLYKKM